MSVIPVISAIPKELLHTGSEVPLLSLAARFFPWTANIVSFLAPLTPKTPNPDKTTYPQYHDPQHEAIGLRGGSSGRASFAFEHIGFLGRGGSTSVGGRAVAIAIAGTRRS